MANTFDILIRKGIVVTGSGMRRADVGIKGEEIVTVKPNLSDNKARQIVDASGKYVMPGVIDVHVHPVYEDDMGGVSLTAVHGGTTTLCHFAYPKPGMKLIDTIKQYQKEGDQKSYLDFGIHGVLFGLSSQIEEIPKAFDLGVTSFKMFMAYAKLKWMTDDYHLAAAMDLIAGCGGLAIVHAENGLVTDYLDDRSLRRGEDQKKVFSKTRPDSLEGEAILRALTIAAITQCRIYIVHLTTAKGLLPIEQAKDKGQTVYVETCPQYLTMTDAKLQKLGPLAKIVPPLRTEKDRLALWKAIQKDVIDTVASDHAPKAKRIDDPFPEAPYGSPQAETMLTVTFDEGVNKGRIKPNKLVQLLSENPAKIFGFYPKKGVIQKGSDADLVIFDPKKSHAIRHENQHSGAPYTLYEGRRCLGKPILTMQRGKILIEEGVVKGKPGDGKFLPTKITKVKL
jgi:dihydropyrimidinase